MIEKSIPVANRDLCRDLYNLSGWTDTGLWWHWGNRYTAGGEGVEMIAEVSDCSPDSLWIGGVRAVPAYHLGYLVARLPVSFPSGPGEFGMLTIEFGGMGGWAAGYSSGFSLPTGYGPTPEDAAAALCIELLKAGRLTKTEETPDA